MMNLKHTASRFLSRFRPGTQDLNQGNQEESGTAPESEGLRNSGVSRAQRQVWENENSSTQGKAYAFDEDVTDANYDVEDDLEFRDDNDSSGQISRYS